MNKNYPGETVRIRVTAHDFVDVPITGDDDPTPAATVTIYDSAGEEVDTGDLTWDADEQAWILDHTTLEAGAYQVRCRFTTVDYDSWEYLKLKVAAEPVTV